MEDDQDDHHQDVPSPDLRSDHDVEEVNSAEDVDLYKSSFATKNVTNQEKKKSNEENEEKGSDLKTIGISEIPEIPEELTDAQHKNMQRRLDLMDMRMAIINKIEANKLLKMQQALVKKAQENQDKAFKNQIALEKLLAKGISLV